MNGKTKFTPIRKFSHSGLLLLLLVILPLLISLHLMSNAVQNTDELSRLFIPLLLFNIFGLFLLMTLIILNIVKLIGQ